MQCSRLDHFVRFNPNGTVSRCGHMVNAPEFNSLQEMENSEWLHKIKQLPWPQECIRCKEIEDYGQDSIRIHSNRFHQKQTIKDYLTVGGVLDNVCNSGCLTCNANCSTKIGSLMSKIYPIFDNTNSFWQLPTHRIVKLDINGGEPSASKNYKQVLRNLPNNVKEVRINTNCSIVIDEIDLLLNRGVHVTVTVSLDGIGDVHDRVRWPITWAKFYKNLMIYKHMGIQQLNTWTTVSALNIGDFENILEFVKEHQLLHSYALLHTPDILSVKYSNTLTIPFKHVMPEKIAVDRNNETELAEFMQQQNSLRNLS